MSKLEWIIEQRSVNPDTWRIFEVNKLGDYEYIACVAPMTGDAKKYATMMALSPRMVNLINATFSILANKERSKEEQELIESINDLQADLMEGNKISILNEQKYQLPDDHDYYIRP